jgi:CheY-like chemotaxis protein
MDDDSLVLSVAENMLRVMKYSVHTSHDGAEAVSLYKSAMERGEPYRFVILDLTVPGGMGGKEAVKKIRELDPGAKIIASSGYSNDPVIVHFREHGFSGVIEKPYRYDDLAAAVASVLSE